LIGEELGSGLDRLTLQWFDPPMVPKMNLKLE